jgi:hypothetical protein
MEKSERMRLASSAAVMALEGSCDRRMGGTRGDLSTGARVPALFATGHEPGRWRARGGDVAPARCACVRNAPGSHISVSQYVTVRHRLPKSSRVLSYRSRGRTTWHLLPSKCQSHFQAHARHGCSRR